MLSIWRTFPVLLGLIFFFNESYGSSNDPRGPALALFYGPFLVEELTGVDEVLPLSGLQFGHRILRSQIEYGALTAKAHNITYHRFHGTFRNPIGGGPIVAHWLLGLHLDRYSSRPTEISGAATKWASGWHWGAGWRSALSQRLSFRNDFRWGFSPGGQLHIQVGLEYFFADPDSP